MARDYHGFPLRAGSVSLPRFHHTRVVATVGLVWIALANCALRALAQVSFAPPVTYNSYESQAAMSAADLNGSGLPDLVVGGSGGIAVFMNNGDGTFAQPPAIYPVNVSCCVAAEREYHSSLIVADLKGDGRPDLAFPGGGGVAVLLNNGDGTFQAPVYYPSGTGLFSLSLVAGDFYHDGRPDLALLETGYFGSGPTITIFRNQGNGTFTIGTQFAAQTAALSLVAVDVNGDGYPDLITSDTNPGNTLSILLNLKNGTFAPPVSYVTGGQSLIIPADLRGNGKPDLVLAVYGAASFQNAYAVMLNKGDGTFAPPVIYTRAQTGVAPAPTDIAVADFNGDGKPDLALYLGYQSGVAILTGNGDGTFNQATSSIPVVSGNPPTNSYPGPIVASDVDGNGDMDLIAGGDSGPSQSGTSPVYPIYVLLNQLLPPKNLGLRLSTDQGGNGGSTTLTIFGKGFTSGDGAELKCAGQSTIVGTSVGVSSNGNALTATFDLNGASPGQCNVVITEPSGTTQTVPQQFTIEQGGAPNVWVDILGWSRLRAAEPQTYFITIGNRGNQDSPIGTGIWIEFPSFFNYTTPPNQSPGGTLQVGPNTILFYQLATPVSAGSTAAIPITFTVPDVPQYAHHPFQIEVWQDSH